MEQWDNFAVWVEKYSNRITKISHQKKFAWHSDVATERYEHKCWQKVKLANQHQFDHQEMISLKFKQFSPHSKSIKMKDLLKNINPIL